MYDTIRNLFLAGLGAAVLTKDKVLELTNHLVEHGRLSSVEAEKMADDLVEESRRQAKNLGEMIDSGLNKAVEALNLANKQELKALQERVTVLEDSVVLLESRLAQLAAAPPEPPA